MNDTQVTIVGAGPVGLCLAIDLSIKGIPVLLLEKSDKNTEGSRAICFAKRTLEILDRLGVGEKAVRKGIIWNTGKVFLKNDLLYKFDLQPEMEHKRPAFINLQQYFLEQFLIERVEKIPAIDFRKGCEVTDVQQSDHRTLITIKNSKKESHKFSSDFLVACDGASSFTRRTLNLDAKGKVFNDRFLIADVKMKAKFPIERWFWFDPPFHPNQSVLLHRQADDVWRIDFQLGWDVDPEEEKRPEKVMSRIKAMLGPDIQFSLEWVSIYTFQCRKMDNFVHNRVIFAGDAAHQVSPFGARGANSGIQDADNLAWKLQLVLQKKAAASLLETYNQERGLAANENIMHSTRSTDFITPKNAASTDIRNITLMFAKKFNFARTLVNSGRLSLPSTYKRSVLNTADNSKFNSRVEIGSPGIDAPLLCNGKNSWLLDKLGNQFTLVLFFNDENHLQDLLNHEKRIQLLDPKVKLLVIGNKDHDIVDHKRIFQKRYDARSGTTYLFRPDQHICARWRQFDLDAIKLALSISINSTKI